MSRYARVVAGSIAEYPYTFGKLRADNPTVSFPRNMPAERWAEWDVYEVTEVTRPTPTATQVVTEGAPVKVGNDWTQVWDVREKTAQELNDEDEGRVTDALGNVKLQKLLYRITVEAMEGNGKTPPTPAQFRNFVKNL